MRIKEFQQYLKKEKIDLALFTLPDVAITYFTQCTPESTALLIVTKNKAEFYLTALEEKPKLKDIKVKTLKKGWDKNFPKNKVKRLGINKSALTVASAERFKKIFPKAKLIDVYSEINNLRSKKTPEEIKKMVSACKVTDYAFSALIKNLPKMYVHSANPQDEVRGVHLCASEVVSSLCGTSEAQGYSQDELCPAVMGLQQVATVCTTRQGANELCTYPKMKTEKQVADFLEEKMREKGCSPAFPTVVAMGKNAAIPHHNTSNTKLSRGFLLLDFGARYKNYNSDMSRTIFLGKPTKEEKERYDLLLKVQTEAIKSIKAGTSFWELQQEAHKGLGRYSSHFIHLLGHGIGLEVHEAPSYQEEGKEAVQKNQIFTVEPGIYFYQKYGIRIEDMVLFDGTVKVLTKAEKKLICV